MRLKRDMRIICKILFIFSSIPKENTTVCFRRALNVTSIGLFYKKWEFLGGCLTVKN